MRVLSIVLLVVWLILFGAIQATWVTMSAHNFGVLSVIFGIVILLNEFYVYRKIGVRND